MAAFCRPCDFFCIVIFSCLNYGHERGYECGHWKGKNTQLASWLSLCVFTLIDTVTDRQTGATDSSGYVQSNK